MADETQKPGWEQRLNEAAAHMDQDVRRLVAYLNDEVVPEVRRNGTDALRAAARELNRIAERMDERAGRTPPPPGGPKQP